MEKQTCLIPTTIIQELNRFLNEHINLQLALYQWSYQADELGYNGFSHWLQVQAQDEVLHQRKIMNYLLAREGKIEIGNQNLKTHKFVKIQDIVLQLKSEKSRFLSLTHELVIKAQTAKDMTTIRFLDWFLEDFTEEIDELKILNDHLNLANNEHYRWDRHQAKRQEPETLKVIPPFYEPQ